MYGTNISQAAEQRRQGDIRGAAGMMLGSDAPLRTESEIERELSRLLKADEELSHAVEMLWDRLGRGGVLSPLPESKPEPAMAVETARSALGAELQTRAFNVQGKAERLRDLMRCLCL